MSIAKNVNVSQDRPKKGLRTSALAALRKRGSRVANLWIFDSPKTGVRLKIAGDVPFMHVVLLEGDIDVATYRFVGDPFNLEGTTTDAALPGHVLIKYGDGRSEWGLFARSSGTRKATTVAPKADVLVKAAAAAGATFRVRTELGLRGQEVRFDNWLTLCAIINRARGHSCHREASILSQYLRGGATCNVGELISVAGVDPALMLAVVAKALQNGRISTNLSNRLFDCKSALTGAQP